MKYYISILFILLTAYDLQAQFVNFTSTNLPIIVINTNGQAIVDEPKITADMGIIYNGEGVRNALTDAFNQYNGKIGIEIRGQTSQSFPMKSYSLELRDALGKSVDKSLFGLPKESDWVLYAPYTDKTLMRNVLAYQMSRDLGHWSAHCKFVEVVINGDYKGIYVFMERIKRNAGRVNVPKMAITDTVGNALTGGYIFSLDKEPNGWFSKFTPPNSVNGKARQFSYVYPKIADIVPAQKAYIQSYVDSFEAALASPKFQDPLVGVRQYANLKSFIDYFIVNEVSRNVDGYRLSTFLYKDRNSTDKRIVAGPVWDYDLAFRNADYCSGSDIRGWAYNFNSVCPGDGAGLIPFWWSRLMVDSAFVGELRCSWKQARQSKISTARMNFMVDSISTFLDEAQKRHFARWPVLGIYVWPNPNPIPKTYAEEITVLKSWIGGRLEWIDEYIPDAGACADYTALKGSMAVSVYPNPLVSGSSLKITSKLDQNITIRVVDQLGRVIETRTESILRGINTVSINSSQWPSGVYFLDVKDRSGQGTVYKLVKAKQ